MKPRKPPISISIKVSRRELLLLQRVAFKARRTGGRKLAGNVILRALIRMMKELDVDLSGVKSVEALKDRLLEAKRKS